MTDSSGQSLRKFGWFPKQRSYETGTVRIQALPEFDDAVSAVSESSYVHEGWFYPPIKSEYDEPGKPCPPVSVPWFPLPDTHSLEWTSGAASRELTDFLIFVFGWTQGLQLVPEGCGHLSRVALEPGKLTDFLAFDADVLKILDFAEQFWRRHEKDGASASMFGCIHWFLSSHSYGRYFERFMMQYIVLDAIYKTHKLISGKTCKTHTKRAEHLANELGVPAPSWSQSISGNPSELSKLRNELFHEARFAGAPIGFAFPATENGNILLQLWAFNCRLIAALLGAVGDYTRSSSQTRQPYLLRID